MYGRDIVGKTSRALFEIEQPPDNFNALDIAGKNALLVLRVSFDRLAMKINTGMIYAEYIFERSLGGPFRIPATNLSHRQQWRVDTDVCPWFNPINKAQNVVEA